MIFRLDRASVHILMSNERTAPAMPDLETEARRVMWRSRRGLLELDLLLPPFAQARYRLLTSVERSAYQALLECEDTEIWSWLQRRTKPEMPELLGIVEAILRFNSERC